MTVVTVPAVAHLGMALRQARAWLVTYANDNNWTNHSRQLVEQRLEEATEAFIACIQYEVDRRSRMNEALETGISSSGAPDWNAEEWASHYTRERIIAPIDSRVRVALVSDVESGCVTTEELRYFMINGRMAPQS